MQNSQSNEFKCWKLNKALEVEPAVTGWITPNNVVHDSEFDSGWRTAFNNDDIIIKVRFDLGV